MVIHGQDCDHQVLACGPVAHIEWCENCDCVAIHMGATTVRVDAMAMRALALTLGDAVRALDAMHRPLDTLMLRHAKPGEA